MIHTQLFRYQFLVITIVTVLILPFVCTDNASAQSRNTSAASDSTESDIPPFEIGVGFNGSMIDPPPQWISDYYINALVTISWRIFGGFYIDGGKDFGAGGDISEEWLNITSRRQVYSNRGTNKYGTWIGARYEFNIKNTSFNIIKADAVYIGGGMTWDDIHIRTNLYRSYDYENGWDREEPEYQGYLEHDSKDAFKAGELNGYYVTLAGRWRLDTRKTALSTRRIGNYGVDAGVRYTAYDDYSLGHDSLEPPEDLTSLQIFAKIYLKIGLFD